MLLILDIRAPTTDLCSRNLEPKQPLGSMGSRITFCNCKTIGDSAQPNQTLTLTMVIAFILFIQNFSVKREMLIKTKCSECYKI